MARVSIKTEGVLQRCPKQVVDQGQWLLNLYLKLPMLRRLMHINGVARAVSGVAEYLAHVERRTLIPYVLPQAESYPISPRQTESYPNITEAYSRQTESHPSQTELCSSRTEAHPLPDLNPAI